MPKNQSKPKAKKYRRDRNHAEFLDNIEFFSIILKNQIILVYDPPADWADNYFYVTFTQKFYNSVKIFFTFNYKIILTLSRIYAIICSTVLNNFNFL